MARSQENIKEGLSQLPGIHHVTLTYSKEKRNSLSRDHWLPCQEEQPFHRQGQSNDCKKETTPDVTYGVGGGHLTASSEFKSCTWTNRATSSEDTCQRMSTLLAEAFEKDMIHENEARSKELGPCLNFSKERKEKFFKI